MNQKAAWEAEHTNPHHLIQMDSREGSSGVKKFYQWLKEQALINRNGSVIEMGCGKGRNTAWLQNQGLDAYGFDFSTHAIKTAEERFVEPTFKVADATQTWPWQDHVFDYGLDCFALTDIDSKKGRAFAVKEFTRVIKPGGYLCAYLMSDDDEYHKSLIQTNPAPNQTNAFFNPNGKFEKVFSDEEIAQIYADWKIIEWHRIEKKAEFHGQSYVCKHHWLVLQNQ